MEGVGVGECLFQRVVPMPVEKPRAHAQAVVQIRPPGRARGAFRLASAPPAGIGTRRRQRLPRTLFISRVKTGYRDALVGYFPRALHAHWQREGPGFRNAGDICPVHRIQGNSELSRWGSWLRPQRLASGPRQVAQSVMPNEFAAFIPNRISRPTSSASRKKLRVPHAGAGAQRNLLPLVLAIRRHGSMHC